MTPVPLSSVDGYAGADFLSAPIASYLFDDLFDSFLRPTGGVDRAEVLERAWEHAWPSDSMMTKGFYTHQAAGDQPFLLLNGTNVENACRVLVSAIKTQVEADARFCSRDGELPAPVGQEPPHDDAGSTIDLANQLCASCDIRFSTAALASARFPFVSPAGRVDDADGGTTIDVVDGGYRDNSGATTLVDLWPSVAAATTETFGPAGECVRPIFLQIDNGYSASATATSAPIDINQVLVPLQTERNIAGAVENRGAPAIAAPRARRRPRRRLVPDHHRRRAGHERPARLGAVDRGAAAAPSPAPAERRHHRHDQGAAGQRPAAVHTAVNPPRPLVSTRRAWSPPGIARRGAADRRRCWRPC